MQEFVGVIYAMGSVGTLLGVGIYHKYLRHWTFRTLLMWAQVLLALSGMLDLVMVTRVNRKLLIPDTVFAVVDEGVSSVNFLHVVSDSLEFIAAIFLAFKTTIYSSCLRILPSGEMI